MEKFIKRTLYADFQGFRHIWKFIKPADHQFNKPKFRFNKQFVKLTLVPGKKFNKLFVKFVFAQNVASRSFNGGAPAAVAKTQSSTENTRPPAPGRDGQRVASLLQTRGTRASQIFPCRINLDDNASTAFIRESNSSNKRFYTHQIHINLRKRAI